MTTSTECSRTECSSTECSTQFKQGINIMAGIEKMCQLSGEHGGWDMHTLKFNSLQVLPKHLPIFKDENALIIFCCQPELVDYASDGPNPFIQIPIGKRYLFIHKIWTRYYWQWKKHGTFYRRPSMVWTYYAYVPDIPGKVNGLYKGCTFEPEKALIALKKLFKKTRVETVPDMSDTSHKLLSIHIKSFYKEHKLD